MIIEAGVKRDFKDRLYGEFARVGKALGSPHRLEILEVLAQGERSVESLASETGLSVANASRHLQQLRQAQLVLSRREGLFVHYRLAGPEVVSLVVALRHTAEQHLAELDRVVRDFLGDRDDFEPVTPEELSRRMTTGDVVVLDVRPEQEYAAGHIAGAHSVPVSGLRAVWLSSTATRSTWRTAAGPTAYMPTKLSRCCVHTDSRRNALPRVTRSGGCPVGQSERPGNRTRHQEVSK